MVVTTFKQQDSGTQTGAPIAARIVIAVDGPAASGKGTLARKLAERLGYAYLDTGALYRAVALAVLELGGDPSDVDDVKPALAIIRRNLTPELLANPELRTAAVSEAASRVAAIPHVRAELLDYQREFAKNPPGSVGGAILDGRDIGTVICPDADIKFFVTAKVEERARRRFKELEKTGISYDQVLSDLKARDQRDAGRSVAPTLAAVDSYTLDTTALDAAAALEEAVAVLKSKLLSMATAD
jgi:cytidylate kinase